MNLANKITMFRVILIPFFLVVMLGDFFQEPQRNYIATGIFVLASLTDWLDGYIARSRNLITNFGKFVDPLADKLLVLSALVSMVELLLIPAYVVIIIIGREFIVTGFRLIAVEKNIVIAAGFSGKLKTAVQMIMIIFILLGFNSREALIFADVLIFASVALSIYSAVEYIVKNKEVLSGTM